MSSEAVDPSTDVPQTCLPAWGKANLPEPKRLGWRNLAGFIGPGIVMCGIQIAGGEWLFGPAITARYGGGLMWIATIAILVQVFYNVECGRYALYCGEPVFTGFMRSKPGPAFWICAAMLLSVGALIPGLSTNAAVLITGLVKGRPAASAGIEPGDELAVAVPDKDPTPVSIVGGDQLQYASTENGFALSGTGVPHATVALLRSDGSPLTDHNGNPVTAVVDAAGNWQIAMFDDTAMVNTIAYLLLGVVVLPILIGGKVYNMLQVVMTAKVFIVLSFCMITGLFFVSSSGWFNVFSGFLKFGNVPVDDGRGGEVVVNAFALVFETGEWPVIALTNIALLGAFAGYAGGGGLANSTYSNFVRDKGWGMGSRVGAIASAIGGRNVTLSHLGKVFPINQENLRRWRGWWRYIIADQVLIWAPGCFMGMALPALMSIEFSQYSPLYGKSGVAYSQPIIAADGIRNAPDLGDGTKQIFWVIALLVGLIVFLPSQMSIVEDFARRFTDMIWSGNRRVRESMGSHQVKYIFYTIVSVYVLWSFIAATIFLRFGNAPTLMVTFVANINNVAIGFTAFHVLWINRNFLPKPLRPRWYSQIGIAGCGIFYLGLAGLVFFAKILPLIAG